ncbi:MAG: efflux RND transporter periplasmic adaptor subunit [Halieaceae bacterium]|nr:efflux RND transporter periplasmic adaptor subunit [Halieaceae bacterium]
MPQLPEAQRSLDTDPVYRCPMHPDVMQNEAGRCPICGMELVADTATSAPRDARPAAVQLDSAVVQTLGVRVVQVEERPRVEWISAPGRMAYDETRLYHLHPRAAGWIEDLRIRAEGDPVSTGETLAALYAPDILSAQVNFLIALRDASDSRQVANARSLLRLLAVPDQIILDIEKTGETRNTVPVVAPSDGVITGLQARDGMYVAPETAMFTIADLSYLWLLLDVRETESALLSKGQPVEIKLDALPGRRFEGRVDYLYPQLDPQTRSRPVRVVLDNRTGELQPGLWAEARIRVGDGSTMSAIPRDALISDGRSEHVLVILEDGRFEAREIETGAVYDDWIEVLAGVRVGEHLAGSAQFLIDSESDLQAELRRLDGGAGSAGGHDHVH